MILTLDKNLPTERSLDVDTVNERPIGQTLTASRFLTVENGEVFPKTDDFGVSSKFSTVEIISDGEKFPISGKYNVILDYSIQFSEIGRRFTVSLTLGSENENE